MKCRAPTGHKPPKVNHGRRLHERVLLVNDTDVVDLNAIVFVTAAPS